MDQKTISWLSYITVIGWVIALVSYNGSPDKSSLARFHLRQSLGIFITWILLYIVAMMVTAIMPYFFFLYIFLYFIIWAGIIVLLILGIVGAANGEEKAVPLFGDLYQKTLTFIS
jgi:uncharacterized membrane protein